MYGAEFSVVHAGWITRGIHEFGLTTEFTREDGNLHRREVTRRNEPAFGYDRVLRSRYGTRPGMPPPYPELLWPSSLLNAYSLELLERVEVAGRRALRIAATAAPGVWRAAVYTRPERIEVIGT